MIFKVQLPLETNDENAPALVYNEDKTIITFIPVTEDLLKRMGDGKRPKAFFYGEVIGPVEAGNTTVYLGEEAPWQDW